MRLPRSSKMRPVRRASEAISERVADPLTKYRFIAAWHPGAPYSAFGFTALAKFAKKSSATFLAAPLTRRYPSCASLPPIWASTL